MSEGIETAVLELGELNRAPERCQGNASPDEGEVILIDYRIPFGQYSGEKIRLGIQIPPSYNQSFPHWIHLPKDIKLPGAATNGNANPESSLFVPGYQKWSRPPKDIWQDKSKQNMDRYIAEHLQRIWRQ